MSKVTISMMILEQVVSGPKAHLFPESFQQEAAEAMKQAHVALRATPAADKNAHAVTVEMPAEVLDKAQKIYNLFYADMPKMVFQVEAEAANTESGEAESVDPQEAAKIRITAAIASLESVNADLSKQDKLAHAHSSSFNNPYGNDVQAARDARDAAETELIAAVRNCLQSGLSEEWISKRLTDVAILRNLDNTCIEIKIRQAWTEVL